MAPFVLDQVDNPHPRMRRAALEYRRRALVVRQAITDQLTVPDVATVGVLLRWETYLECMCDATGCTAAEIEAWLDRDVDPVRSSPEL